MPISDTHVWHGHTVSGERWLALKAEYAQRCGPRLDSERVARDSVQRLRAIEAALLPADDAHPGHT